MRRVDTRDEMAEKAVTAFGTAEGAQAVNVLSAIVGIYLPIIAQTLVDIRDAYLEKK